MADLWRSSFILTETVNEASKRKKFKKSVKNFIFMNFSLDKAADRAYNIAKQGKERRSCVS